MDNQQLFDTTAYSQHPSLWPPLSDDVMSDDQAAELIWPGATGESSLTATQEKGDEMAMVPLWDTNDEGGTGSW